MKTVTLITFELPRKEKGIGMDKATKLYRKLYGYNNSSYYGKYHTRVDGLLDKLNGIKIARSVIMVKNENVEEVCKLLNEYQAEIIHRKVIPNKDDIIKMKLE